MTSEPQNDSQEQVFDGTHFSPQFEIALRNFLRARYKSSSGTNAGGVAGATFTIPHGLGVTPTIVAVDGFTGTHQYYEYQAADSTNIYIENGSGTASGSFLWFAAYIAN